MKILTRQRSVVFGILLRKLRGNFSQLPPQTDWRLCDVCVCHESPVISISISLIVTASAQLFVYQLTIAGVFEGIFLITISKRTDLGKVSLKALDGWSPPLRTGSPIRVRQSKAKPREINHLQLVTPLTCLCTAKNYR